MCGAAIVLVYGEVELLFFHFTFGTPELAYAGVEPAQFFDFDNCSAACGAEYGD